jgi:hypothetical protein
MNNPGPALKKHTGSWKGIVNLVMKFHISRNAGEDFIVIKLVSPVSFLAAP